ncbi:MAG: Fe2+-dependent dioxygenase [Gammaproteobacteria bacterium]
MLVKIPDILNVTEIDAVRSVLHQCDYVDGKLSAGINAQKYKINEEAAAGGEQFEALNNVVMSRLVQHPVYLNAILPVKISMPIYARYTSGMSYGYHVDDPVMGGTARYRSDVSITIFLSDPDDYDGGELSIETSYGHQQVKLPAGHAILYPSSSRHAVQPVTRGERLVAIAWVQSMVRSPEQRQILFQLYQARDQLSDAPPGKAFQHLDDSYTNLVRMWAEI